MISEGHNVFLVAWAPAEPERGNTLMRRIGVESDFLPMFVQSCKREKEKLRMRDDNTMLICTAALIVVAQQNQYNDLLIAEFKLNTNSI